MAKIIIPRSELPSLSIEQTNRFRFRIVNKNRNLNSEWSVIGEVKRQVDDINYELPSTFSTQPISKSIIVSWEKSNDISQTYDVYMKQYERQFDMISGTFRYYSRELDFSESTTRSSSTVHGIYSDLVGINLPSPQGAQIMVRNFSYPRLTKRAWNVLECERKNNVVKIYLDPGITDFDNTYNDQGKVYVDMTIFREKNVYFTTYADMRVFNQATDIFSVDKTDPNYTILQIQSTGSNITLFKPEYGIVRRIEPDPLFISDYVNYGAWYNFKKGETWEFFLFQAEASP